MDPTDWFVSITTSVTTAGFVTVSLWFSRKLIETWLVRGIEHRFNTKVELLRAELRDKEEKLKAELQKRENEIAFLRDGALTAMSNRQIAVNERRMHAIDQLWSSFNVLRAAKGASLIISMTKYKPTAERAAKDAKIREVFSRIKGEMSVSRLRLDDAQKARPFVSPMVWAMFSAYTAIVTLAIAKLEIIVSGVGMPDIVNDDGVVKIVKATLPHRGTYIEQYGEAGFHNLLDEIEETLLEEIQKMLAGVEADKENVERAGEILRLSNEVSAAARLNEVQLQADRSD